jgi:hypothetical protein
MATSMTSGDLKRIAAEVSIQHGIRLDADDPMMAVVTLNRLVFEQAVADVLERVQLAVRDFEAAADKVQVRAGGVLAQEVRECGVSMRQEFAKAFEEFRRDRPGNPKKKSGLPVKPAAWIWLVIGLMLALALLGLGFFVGNKLR